MNDRELLEAAAEAAGHCINAVRQAQRDAIGGGRGGLWIDDVSTGWNPLTDDGDALRLAVKLGMEILPQEPLGVLCVVRRISHARAKEPYGDSQTSAVRRAIVRAAAEISRAKGGSE